MQKITAHLLASQIQQPMGQLSENITGNFNISRVEMTESFKDHLHHLRQVVL